MISTVKLFALMSQGHLTAEEAAGIMQLYDDVKTLKWQRDALMVVCTIAILLIVWLGGKE